MSLLVGASGFSFASWRPGFYPAGTRPEGFLRFYAGRALDGRGQLDASTACRSAETFERWAATVPDGFRFAVRCRGRSPSTAASTTRPPSASGSARWATGSARCSCARPTTASATTASCAPCSTASTTDLWPAFDLRHPSWDGVEELLEGRAAVRVNQLDAPAPFRYLRLREPPYDDAALAAWADRLRPLLDDGLAVHCYFRHEDEPTAPAYARRLLELVEGD